MPNSRAKIIEEQMKIETKIKYSLRMLHIRLRGRLQDLSFFDHLPPYVYIFYGIKVYKKSIFLTSYPPPLVNLVCERPLRPFNK